MYKTRLLRVDQEPRTRHDPLQRWLHKCLRYYRYRGMARKHQDAEKGETSNFALGSYQHTILITTIASRIVVALMMSSFLIIPLVVLARIAQKNIQILIISLCIIIFAAIVPVILKTTSLEFMAVSAAYAAILSVFVSNMPT